MSSTELMFASLQYLITFSIPPGMLLQLYVIAPIWTPPKFEFGTPAFDEDGTDELFALSFIGTIEHAAIAAVLPRNFLLDTFLFIIFFVRSVN
jgi:hypothetical protein